MSTVKQERIRYGDVKTFYIKIIKKKQQITD